MTEKAVELQKLAEEIGGGWWEAGNYPLNQISEKWPSDAAFIELASPTTISAIVSDFLQHVRALKVARESMKAAVALCVTASDRPFISFTRDVHAELSSALGDIEMLVPSEKSNE